MSHSSLAASALSSGAGSVIAIIVLILLVVLAIVVLLIISAWKIYEKAGVPGWASLIPFYNSVKLLQITGKPLWWIIPMLFLPGINIIFFIYLYRRLAAVFGKGVGFTWGLILLPFIFWPILGFGKSQYINTFPPAKPMSEAVKWTLIVASLFLIVEGVAIASLGRGSSSPAPLKVISSELGYATDGNYVYENDEPIYGADVDSFKVDGDYGMDDNSVYSDGVAIPNVDPSHFNVLADGAYAIDGDTVYYDGTPVAGADASTFTLVEDTSPTKNYDAKDANQYYFEGEAVTGSD